MAVYDALVVLAWIMVNILYVQQRVSLILPIFKRMSTFCIDPQSFLSVCIGPCGEPFNWLSVGCQLPLTVRLRYGVTK